MLGMCLRVGEGQGGSISWTSKSELIRKTNTYLQTRQFFTGSVLY